MIDVVSFTPASVLNACGPIAVFAITGGQVGQGVQVVVCLAVAVIVAVVAYSSFAHVPLFGAGGRIVISLGMAALSFMGLLRLSPTPAESIKSSVPARQSHPVIEGILCEYAALAMAVCLALMMLAIGKLAKRLKKWRLIRHGETETPVAKRRRRPKKYGKTGRVETGRLSHRKEREEGDRRDSK